MSRSSLGVILLLTFSITVNGFLLLPLIQVAKEQRPGQSAAASGMQFVENNTAAVEATNDDQSAQESTPTRAGLVVIIMMVLFAIFLFIMRRVGRRMLH